MYSGDPITGRGWLDDPPLDKRMIVSGPPTYSFTPGNSFEVVFAIVMGRGTDHLTVDIAGDLRAEKRAHRRDIATAMLHNDVTAEEIFAAVERVDAEHADRRAAHFRDLHLQLHLLKAGDALTFAGTVPHGPEKLLKTPIRMLSIIIYADGMEDRSLGT